MTPEIEILIIGAILGAGLTLIVNRIEKIFDSRKEKEKAIMCLKIELRRIEKFTNSLSNTESKFGQVLPDQDIPEFDLTVQIQQFMYYNENLASKIYGLSKCLESANKRRQVAYDLIKERGNPKFTTNAEMFKNELKETRQFLEDINELVHFKRNE